MPYNRAGNPRCFEKSCVNEWGWGPFMVRAYVRLGDPRKWVPVGWYCEKCHKLEPESNFKEDENWPYNQIRVKVPEGVDSDGRRTDIPRPRSYY